MKRLWLRWLFCLVVPGFLLWMPASWMPFAQATLIEQRVMALFVFAALLWITEPIPAYATSLLIVLLSLLFLSDRGWIGARTPSPDLGRLLSYQEIMACFASPIVLLFLGGLFLALAAQKYRLDQNLARLLLRPFGENPRLVMLGMMGITAFFSMFMSNTATTVMMLSILVPVLEGLDPEDKGRIGFALSIPLSSNIGGLGTPIGTPPNAVALKYLVGSDVIHFGQWMCFGVPVVCVLVLIAWLALQAMYPIQTPKLRLQIEGRFRTGSLYEQLFEQGTSAFLRFVCLFTYKRVVFPTAQTKCPSVRHGGAAPIRARLALVGPPTPALPREQGRERKSEAAGILFFHDTRCMHDAQTLPVPTSP
ncbi:anion permease, partial [Myxococcota bacterium]|nr:anion permease [Myxococcota bacterium]